MLTNRPFYDTFCKLHKIALLLGNFPHRSMMSRIRPAATALWKSNLPTTTKQLCLTRLGRLSVPRILIWTTLRWRKPWNITEELQCHWSRLAFIGGPCATRYFGKPPSFVHNSIQAVITESSAFSQESQLAEG